MCGKPKSVVFNSRTAKFVVKHPKPGKIKMFFHLKPRFFAGGSDGRWGLW